MAATHIVVQSITIILLSESFLQVHAIMDVDNAKSLVQQALTIPEGKCGIGMFFDTEMKSCISVYCPQYFIKNNGVCLPSYHTMENAYFKAEFTIRTPSRLTVEQSEDIVKLYASEANTLIGNTFSNYRYQIYLFAPRGYFLECRLIIYFVEEETNITFLRNYALLQLLIDGIHDFRAEMNGTNIEFISELASGISNIDYVGRNYKLVFTNGFLDTLNKSETRLSKSSFCYRVMLSDNEIVQRTVNRVILRNGINIWLTDVTLNGNSDEMVCIDAVISGQHFLFTWDPKLSDILFSTSPGSTREGRDETKVDSQKTNGLNDRLANITNEIIVTIVFVCLVILIVLTRCVLSLIQRLQQSTEPHDDPTG